MREKISLCKKNSDNTLSILCEKKLVVELDEGTMELMATYQGKKYQVQGSFVLSYIVIE